MKYKCYSITFNIKVLYNLIFNLSRTDLNTHNLENNLLLDKLNQYGVRGVPLSLLGSYLHN